MVLFKSSTGLYELEEYTYTNCGNTINAIKVNSISTDVSISVEHKYGFYSKLVKDKLVLAYSDILITSNSIFKVSMEKAEIHSNQLKEAIEFAKKVKEYLIQNNRWEV